MGNLPLALWKRLGHARIGALPALGHLLSKRIPQYLLIRMTYPGRLLARDLLFDRSIVRRETPVETGVAGDFAG